MDWVFETIALSVITVLLFLLMLTRKPGHVKLLLGVLTAVAAAASLVLFILMQRAAGNPDQGKELIQMYIPCGIYALVVLWGILTAAASRRKLRLDKAAKAVAKGKAKAEDTEKTE